MSDTGSITLADGTRIVYRVVGEGPPLMLFNGVTTSNFFWDSMLEFWKDRKVILWDYPGHGDSPPAATPDSARVQSLAETGLRVMDAVGVERAPCIGYSMGSQVAIASALEAPDRYSAVVSLLGPAGPMLDTALWGVLGKTAGVLLRTLPTRGLSAMRWMLGGTRTLTPTYYAARIARFFGPETRREHVESLRRHMLKLDPETLRAMILSAAETDLRPRLRDLEPPLLIISGERDVFAPTHTVGRDMHAHAPDAQLIVMEDGTHGSLFGHAPALAAMIDRFLTDHAPPNRGRS